MSCVMSPCKAVTVLCMTSAFSQGGDVMVTAYHWTSTLSEFRPIGRPLIHCAKISSAGWLSYGDSSAKGFSRGGKGLDICACTWSKFVLVRVETNPKKVFPAYAKFHSRHTSQKFWRNINRILQNVQRTLQIFLPRPRSVWAFRNVISPHIKARIRRRTFNTHQDGNEQQWDSELQGLPQEPRRRGRGQALCRRQGRGHLLHLPAGKVRSCQLTLSYHL